MRVGIICACNDELMPFLESMQNYETKEKSKLKFYCGNINGVSTFASFSGIGKVNAAIAAQILIDTFKVDIVINSGTAGGMDPDLKILDTVISTEAVYHDITPDVFVSLNPWMKSEYFHADPKLIKASENAVKKLNPPHKVYWGTMATGDKFIETDGRQAIINKYAPLSVDMETAGIAHACLLSEVPFISVRCITDIAEHSGTGTFEENCRAASVIARDITVALIDELTQITE